jgi:hypothetical protein
MKTTMPAWQCEFEDCGKVWAAKPGQENQPPRNCAGCHRINWHERKAKAPPAPVAEQSYVYDGFSQIASG